MKKMILPCLALTIITSCNKGSEEPQQPPKDMSGIYIAGHDIWLTNSSPKIWKDGAATNFSNGVGITTINSIFVSDNAVYAVGKEEVNGTSTNLKFWKDGQVTTKLSGFYSAYNSVEVSGNDVFIAGTEHKSNYTTAMLWKNGEAIWLAGGSGWPAEAYDVAFHNGDVYAVGRQYDFAKQYYVAKIWKNGVATELTTSVAGIAFHIQIAANGDVYILGGKDRDFVIWKNGNVIQTISNAYPNAGYFRSMYLNGSDLYVVGDREINNYMVPFITKNGVETILPTTANWGNATDVFVKGSDVYVIGREPFVGGYARGIIWKNGIRTALTDGSSNTVLTDIIIK